MSAISVCRNLEASTMQLHYQKLTPPDLVAQAADFPCKDAYNLQSTLLDPFELKDFQKMAQSLWPELDEMLDKLNEVGSQRLFCLPFD